MNRSILRLDDSCIIELQNSAGAGVIVFQPQNDPPYCRVGCAVKWRIVDLWRWNYSHFFSEIRDQPPLLPVLGLRYTSLESAADDRPRL